MATIQDKKPRISIIDHVNNYFYMHQNEAVRASDLKETMLSIGSPVKSAVQHICLLVKRGDVVCAKKGAGQRQSVYMATAQIQYITESRRTRVYQRKFADEVERQTPEGVLMLQNIFIPNSAVLIGMANGA